MQDLLKSACPHCDGHIEYTLDDCGHELPCPHCGDPIILVGLKPVEQPSPMPVIRRPPIRRTRNEPWANDPATGKQKNKLEFFGATCPKGLTKGEASDWITQLAADNPDIERTYRNRPATDEQIKAIKMITDEFVLDPDEEPPINPTYASAKEWLENWRLENGVD